MVSKIFVVIAVKFLLLGCATYGGQAERERFNQSSCLPKRAFERGYNDALDRMAMNSKFSFHCRHDLRDKAQKEYKSGYDKGRFEVEREDKEELQEKSRRKSIRIMQ